MTRSRLWVWLVVAACLAACGDDADRTGAAPEPAVPAEPPPSFEPTGALTLPARIDYIAVGGGADPASSQVSLEQDLGLVREVFDGLSGVVLHAGGGGAAAVHEIDERDERSETADPLVARLAALFDPREARNATYRQSAISPDGPSTPSAFDEALARALAESTGVPLFLYINGHGDYADEAADTAVLLWGGEALTARGLSELLDAHPRPVRAVVTSCYSGGFTELAFRGADPARGATVQDRCGLFATTADREASGCDPNPDRAAQEGFSLHFLHALRGEDARGRPLPAAAVDFDADGSITLYEAHARARIAGRSIDVPTTTAERFLRERVVLAGARDDGAGAAVERAVANALGRDLELDGEERARERLDAIEATMLELTEHLDSRGQEADAAWSELRTELLSRWPVLDDPWGPSFHATIEAHREAIHAFLDRSAAARRYSAAERRIAALDERLLAMDAQAARVTRLVRAHENIRLEARLRAAGRRDYGVYQRMRACESTPVRPR